MSIGGALLLAAALAGAAEPSREEMLAAGERALAQADAQQAAILFQRAGYLKHAADAEIGLTLAYMQGGEYRRALAFAAHTAGVHQDPNGKALYVQLLELGGQQEMAARVLKIAASRFAPASPQSLALPAGARVVSSGLLVDGGWAVLARALDGESLWVRNASGALVKARAVRRLGELMVLDLDQALEGAALSAAPRDAFAGSPAFALDYPASEEPAPAWPLMRAGFIGRHDLGIALPPGPRGGPVLDHAGRIVGVALPDRLVPVSSFKAHLVEAPADAPRMPIEEIYERALAATVQVIAAGR